MKYVFSLLFIVLGSATYVFAEGQALYSVDGEKSLKSVTSETGGGKFQKSGGSILPEPEGLSYGSSSGKSSWGWLSSLFGGAGESSGDYSAKKFPNKSAKKNSGGSAWSSQFHSKRKSPYSTSGSSCRKKKW